MKKKNLKLLVLIFSLAIIFILAISFKNTEYEYNSLIKTSDEFSEIITSRKESKVFLISNLKFNNYVLLLDQKDNHYYYSLIKNNDNSYNPIVSFNSNDVKICFDEEITEDLIKENGYIQVLTYNKFFYHIDTLSVTTLPLMSINVSEEPALKDVDYGMELYLFDNRENINNREIKATGKIHARGYTSITFPKRGFKIKLTNKKFTKRNDNYSLLDLRQKDAEYILYAAYNDQERVRNVFSSNLWYEANAKDNIFNADNGMYYKYVELFLNGRYWGLYALGFPIDEKQLDINKNDIRENIYKKINWDDEEQIDFSTAKDIDGYSLKTNEENDEAWKPLLDYYNTVLNSVDIKELYNIIDLNNSIDVYLYNSLIQGVDGPKDNGIKNIYISSKVKGDKIIYIYTPWDMDYSWGNKIGEINSTEAYGMKPTSDISFNRLCAIQKIRDLNDPFINNHIKKRYFELRKTQWSNDTITKMIDDLENDIYNSGAYSRDIDRWPDSNNQDPELKLKEFKKYVMQRFDYFDNYINSIFN